MPVPVPFATPAPIATPVPAPIAMPVPVPFATPVPVPAPIAMPVPVPIAMPAPTPVPAPQSTTPPYIGPVPSTPQSWPYTPVNPTPTTPTTWNPPPYYPYPPTTPTTPTWIPESVPVTPCVQPNPEVVSRFTIYQGDYVDGFYADDRPLIGKIGGGKKQFSWPASEYIVKAQVYVSWDFVNSLIFTTNTGRSIGQLGSVTNWPGVLAITNITSYDAPQGYALVGYNATSRLHPDPYYGAVLVNGFVPIWGPLFVPCATPTTPSTPTWTPTPIYQYPPTAPTTPTTPNWIPEPSPLSSTPYSTPTASPTPVPTISVPTVVVEPTSPPVPQATAPVFLESPSTSSQPQSSVPVNPCSQWNPNVVSRFTIYQGDYVDGFYADDRPLVGKIGGAEKHFFWPSDEYIVKAQVYVSWDFVNSLIFTTNTGRSIGQLGSVMIWPDVVAATNITSYDAPQGYALVGYNATSRVHPDPYYGAVIVNGFVPIWGSLLIPCTSSGCVPVSGGNVFNPALTRNVTVMQGDFVYGVVGDDGKIAGNAQGSGTPQVYTWTGVDSYVDQVSVSYPTSNLVSGISFRTKNATEMQGSHGNVTVGLTVFTYTAEPGYGMVGWTASSKLISYPEEGRFIVSFWAPVWGPVWIDSSSNSELSPTCFTEPVVMTPQTTTCSSEATPVSNSYINPDLVQNGTFYQKDFIRGFVINDQALVGQPALARAFSLEGADFVVGLEIFRSYGLVSGITLLSNSGANYSILGAAVNAYGASVTRFNAPATGFALVGFEASSRVANDSRIAPLYDDSTFIDNLVPLWAPVRINASTTPCQLSSVPSSSSPSVSNVSPVENVFAPNGSVQTFFSTTMVAIALMAALFAL